MASVASPINLAAQATWPITLADSITSTKRSKTLTSVRYNHLPKVKDRAAATRSITPLPKKGACKAAIKSGNQEWRYTGTHGSATESYVLVLSEEEGHKKATLERIDTIVALNLSATPVESDAEKLQNKYKQLSLANEDDHDAGAAGHTDDASPDTDNPFDYRHFLDDATTKQTTHNETPRSTVSTPVVQPSSRVSKPTPVPSKKRKTAVEAQPPAKRAKATQQAKTSKSEVPAVRLERKASMPQPRQNDDDDGELILENDDDAPSAKHQSAMSMALNGQLGPQLGNRPISLHSAASSPASRIYSPAPVRPEDDEFTLGDDEDAHEEDGDVEHLGLPSPVHDRTASGSFAKAPIDVEEDDDYDLEKQLAEAMGQDDTAPVVVQEEEESEEE